MLPATPGRWQAARTRWRHPLSPGTGLPPLHFLCLAFRSSARGIATAEAGRLRGQAVTLSELQSLIRSMYHEKDASRGVDGTFMWLVEEVGELASALRAGTPEEQALEFADVLAWLATIANVAGVDLEAAVNRKYGSGCPGCGQAACICPDEEKP
jgi:NTP pyrophosphatase (non-canonical NTP hydrolase)